MIVETRHRLREWGQWARGGYPTVSSMFNAIFGSHGDGLGEMPKHIQEIDIIVCRAELEHRVILVNVYGMGGSFREKALVLGLPRTTLRRRLESAEWYVNSILDGVDQHNAYSCKYEISAPQAN